MKKINFIKPRSIDQECLITFNALESLGLNNFFSGWVNHSITSGVSLENKFNYTDSLEINFQDQNERLNLNKEFFYKSPYCKYNYRIKNNYHLLDTIPVDKILESKKNKKVLYRYNSEWFRSDHFKKEHDGLHIVFTGCSNTEGVGANIEDTWSHMLYTELSKKYKIDGYYNLAKSGAGWHIIVQNFIIYVEKYGAPDYLFILHPNILRYFIWEKETKGWRYSSNGPETSIWWEEHKKHFPTWSISFKLFLKYCESIGTKVLWSTWDDHETDNIINIDIFNNTFFPISMLSNEIIKDYDYYPLMERDDAGNARDGHDGYIQQYHWFNMFKEEIEKRKMIKVDLLNEV